mmetsp:Transcript_26681/g.103706  ORF Transcript_26681/g.103706 Transcript_26681/m.103706 type:complete len:100 (-) Transcript_26681:60-359(-)
MDTKALLCRHRPRTSLTFLKQAPPWTKASRRLDICTQGNPSALLPQKKRLVSPHHPERLSNEVNSDGKPLCPMNSKDYQLLSIQAEKTKACHCSSTKTL